MPELLDFTRMTGDLVRAIRACPQVVIAAVDGVCAGAGAIIAMAADMRLATKSARTAFLFTRVGLAGCDMGACAILPRLIGQGRAAELLFTGRAMTAEEGLAWGFYSRLLESDQLLAAAQTMAETRCASGPGVCARHDEEHAESGVEHEPRSSHRGGGAGPGDMHEDGGFQTRLRRLRSARHTGVRRPMMPAPRYHGELLALPFFEAVHRSIADQARAWAAALDPAHHDESPAAVDARCRELVARLGEAGLTRYCVRQEFGGALPDFDARAICLIRETLAYHDGLADFAFAMQGLGSGAISLAGSGALQRRYLPPVARGEAIAAFALSEPEAGSDVAALSCRAERSGDHYRARRDEDLDLERRNRRFLLRVCANRRGSRALGWHHERTRHQRLRRGVERSGALHRTAHRGQRAASTRRARVRSLPNSRGPADRRRGRGVQDRDAHARCVPRLRGGGGHRLCAPRPR